jgi:uncharacterized protein YkwD
MECELFEKINDQRIMNGVSALRISNNFAAMAQSHSDDMATNDFFSHTSPYQGSFTTRAAAFNVRGTIGENIAGGSSDLDRIVNNWMNSSGHRANILNNRYLYTGIGVAQRSSGGYYYTQVFSANQ